jgi:hypothetical protein
MSLTAHIRTFVRDELAPYLVLQVQNYAENHARFALFELAVENSPRLVGKVRPQNGGYLITISDGWLLRLTLIFHVIEAMWNTRDQRPKVFAVNTESALDSLIFYGKGGLDYNFSIAPILKSLFVNIGDASEHMHLIETFGENFNEEPPGGGGECASIQAARTYLACHSG